MAKLLRLDRRSFVPSQTPHRLTGDAAPETLIELADLQRILDEAGPQVEVSQVCEVQAGPHHFPVQAITLGNPSKDVPAVGFFGGVHGLERIGSRVVMAYLRS